MFLLASAIATTMNLVCPGVWTTSGSDTAFVKFKWVPVDTTRASEGEVRIELSATAGRLERVDGKKSKSWPLSDVRLDGGRIEARMRFNFYDKPHVIIDPAAGRIRINGWSSSFLGVCQNAGPSDPL